MTKAEHVDRALGLGDQFAEPRQRPLVELDQLVDARVQAVKRVVVGWQHQHVVGRQRLDARQLGQPVAQRVAIKDPKMTETLYNSERQSTSKAKADKFEMDPAYDMTRTGDTGADVTVRIQFMNQTRDSNGNYTDKPKEIPASDARRAWAKDTAEGAVKKWNGRLTLVGEGTDPVSKATTKKRLPLTFNSVAVFGAHEPYHNRVIVYPQKVVAGSPGQPIDAANWYMNKGTSYDGDDKLFDLSGDDTLQGGSGREALHVFSGDNRLYAGSGADTLFGGGGADTLVGGGLSRLPNGSKTIVS